MDELWWYVIRASGLATWALAAADVVLGLAMSTGLVAVRSTRRLHAWFGGLATGMLALHLLSLVADGYMDFGPTELLVPFASTWRPGAITWGVLALYLLVAVEATSLLRHRLPTRAWRVVHLTSLVAFWAGTLHAVGAGSDLHVPAIGATVLAVVVLVLGLLLLRIGQSVEPGARARLAHRRAARPTPTGRSAATASPATPPRAARPTDVGPTAATASTGVGERRPDPFAAEHSGAVAARR